jgi:Fanconi anemia group M protein
VYIDSGSVPTVLQLGIHRILTDSEDRILFGSDLTLIASTLEKDGPVAKHLQELGLQLRFANLKMGDFLVSGSTAIERKDSKAFIDSIEDKSIFRQLIDFKREYANPLYVIEGCDLYDNKRVNATKIRSAISYVTILNRVPIIFTQDAKDSAEYIYMISRQAQHGMTFTPIEDEKKRKFSEDKEQQLCIVESLPDVGTAIAIAMLKQFKSLKRLFAASKDDFVSVDGIGDKRADKILRFISKKYS